MKLAAFAAKHGTHLPRIVPTESEARLLDEAGGVRRLVAPPAEGVAGLPDDDHSRHLWAFRVEDIPYVLESAPDVVPALVAGKAKHTNLTGGQPAASGGELWIDPTNAGKLYVNGYSGRYGPKTPQQLEDVVAVFRGLGFDVDSFGWDHDIQKPYARYFR